MADAQQFYDHLEIRDAEARERSLFAMLEHQLAHAKSSTAFYREHLADIAPGDIADRTALAAIPVTRKSDIVARQAADPPFGGLNGAPLGEVSHVYVSPGPVYEPDAATKDYWGFARAFWAAGIRPGDLVYNTFAYHLTPAAAMIMRPKRLIWSPVWSGDLPILPARPRRRGGARVCPPCARQRTPRSPRGCWSSAGRG